jgi:hypothetical protein
MMEFIICDMGNFGLKRIGSLRIESIGMVLRRIYADSHKATLLILNKGRVAWVKTLTEIVLRTGMDTSPRDSRRVRGLRKRIVCVVWRLLMMILL